MNDQKKRLGRGLSALFGDDEQPQYNVAYAGDAPVAAVASTSNENNDAPKNKNQQSIMRLPIATLQPSRFQPRRNFDADALKDLATSLKQHGVLQPLMVRALETPTDNGVTHEIIAGERRWRAAQLVPLHDVPVIVREFTAEQALQIALIENLQREDLNPVEEAAGYQRLLDEFQYTQDELAQVIGKSRSHISNMLRVLTLDDKIKDMLSAGKITSGHARALVNAKNPLDLVAKVIDKNLSVRDTEKLAQKETQKYRPTSLKPGSKGVTPVEKMADVLALEKSLSDVLGLTVEIEPGKNMSGKVVIHYKDLDQLDEVLRRLSR
jgi:ParB family chromosome partitioning protein